ncbi:hypothetical protein Tco_0332469 [Tanacetum coccineum]
MAVRVPPAMSLGLSASMAEVTTMSEFVLCKRFRSSYESLLSVSPPDLPSLKRYRGTSKLVEDSEEDDDEEDEEIEESMDFDSLSEDAKDKGPTAEDGIRCGAEGSYCMDTFEGGQSMWRTLMGVGAKRGSGCERMWIAVGAAHAPRAQDDATSGVSGCAGIQPALVKTEGFLTELGAQVGMQRGLIRDHAVQLEELSPALFERSLECEQEKIAVTFEAIWRLMLALEAWAVQTDAQRAALWHAISDVQGEN